MIKSTWFLDTLDLVCNKCLSKTSLGVELKSNPKLLTPPCTRAILISPAACGTVTRKLNDAVKIIVNATIQILLFAAKYEMRKITPALPTI